MQNLLIEASSTTPEIKFSPSERIFQISGTSSPEDVRAIYYPIIEWIRIFVDDFLQGEYPQFTKDSPMVFKVDLTYFNSSSAKFLFDIFTELKRLSDAGKPVFVEWYYDADDTDQKEAGNDIALLVEMNFSYIPK
jgi:hypothetical protein